MLNVHYLDEKVSAGCDIVIEALKLLALKQDIYVIADGYSNDDDCGKRAKEPDKVFPELYVYIEGYMPFFINTSCGDLRGASFIDRNSVTWKLPDGAVFDSANPSISPVGQMMKQIRLFKILLAQKKRAELVQHMPKKGLSVSFYGNYAGVNKVAEVFGISFAHVEPDECVMAQYIKDECMNDMYKDGKDDEGTLDCFLEISDIYCMKKYIDIEAEVRNSSGYFSETGEDDAFKEAWGVIHEGEVMKEAAFGNSGDDSGNSNGNADDSVALEENKLKEKWMNTDIFVKDVHINPVFKSHRINQIIACMCESNVWRNLPGKRLRYLNSIVPLYEMVNHYTEDKSRFHKKFFDDIIMPEIDKVNKYNPFYVQPEDWYPVSKKFELGRGDMLNDAMRCLVRENLQEGYDACKVYEWLHRKHPRMMRQFARAFNADIEAHKEAYNVRAYTGMTEKARELSLDLPQLFKILANLPEELNCAPKAK